MRALHRVLVAVIAALLAAVIGGFHRVDLCWAHPKNRSRAETLASSRTPSPTSPPDYWHNCIRSMVRINGGCEMNVNIQFSPAFALATAVLAPSEGIRVDAGAMVAMSPDLTPETSAQGGLLRSLRRSLFGGESFFQNTYRAGPAGGEISLAPPLPGDISVLELRDQTYLLQSGAYLASSEEVTLDTEWTGSRTFFSREGLFMLQTSGTGIVILSSYGAISEHNLEAGERYRVDTGHLVAFTGGIGYSVQRVGGLRSTRAKSCGLLLEPYSP